MEISNLGKTEKIELKKLARRTGIVSDTDHAPTLNLKQKLKKTSYPKTGNLHNRIDRLHFFMLQEAPKAITKLEVRQRVFAFINFCLAIVIALLVYIIVEPISDILPKFFSGERFAIVDALVNVVTAAMIVLFAVRQILRELCQQIVKDLMDDLHSLIHLLDMHQLAKGDEIDTETRLVIAETILICGKVAAHVNNSSDDPYVLASIKHLESYSELVATRIITTAKG